MSIPFMGLFQKAKARFGKQAPPARVEIPRIPLPEKSAAERLSKTVMPNAVRTMAPDPFKEAAGAKPRPREVSASATAPTGERLISLSIGDILEQLPLGSIKSRESFDANRCISIKAAEAEKGMATGQPTALLTSIYEQAPEIFLQSVTPGDVTQVSLPLEKVLEQFQAVQVRDDQMQDEAIPQVETPFLQVTIEDTQRFGTSIAPLQSSAKPPVIVEPATARSLAKAEPEPVVQQKAAKRDSAARRPISLTPENPPAKGPVPASPAPSAAAAPSAGPTRIPFKLPPNGTGVPVSERVPASSGPPVPNPPPAPPKSSAPVRIPFKMTPPGPELKPKFTLVPGVEPAKREEPEAPAAQPAKEEGVTVRLRLGVCLRNLPAFQLSGSLPEIGDDIVIELPFAVIEPQLASGRVAIDPKLFSQALPETFRDVFVVDATETPVLLPLQEVLQHLPSAALKMRHDQEQEEAINHFETPFSKHAQEDQKRFQSGERGVENKEQEAKPEASVSKPAEPEKPVVAEVENKAAKPEPASPPPVTAPGVDKAPSIEVTSSAKEFVLKASCLPGVTACLIAFADGLTMAGNFPPGLGADGICAMAPSLLQKIEKHMPESDLGKLTAMTLHCAKSPLTFFMEGNVCLTVLHSNRQLEQVTQEQLIEMTKDLAQIFAQPETTHVDH